MVHVIILPVMDTNKPRYNAEDLKALMRRLRDKDNGCPWDIEQDFNTIKPHTIEEAYEVADAIERGNMDDLKDELGDLLFQVVFHAQMAEEESLFTFDDIIDHVTKKMIFRHPHVFGDLKNQGHSAEDIKTTVWEDQKDKEKAAKPKGDNDNHSIFDGVTMALPALSLAQKLQKRARKAGFKYPDLEAVLNKLNEELDELKDAVTQNDPSHIEEEYGDLLFIAALIGKHIDVNAEEALRKANLKFIARFKSVEKILQSEKNIPLGHASLDDYMQAWREAKKRHAG